MMQGEKGNVMNVKTWVGGMYTTGKPERMREGRGYPNEKDQEEKIRVQ